jgi:dihydrofolate reductase
MPTLYYSLGLSADGYINGPDGRFGWAVPSEEQHRFHNQQMAETGVHLLGRRLYETMLPWDLQEWDTPAEAEFARAWRDTEKIVFSNTLETVQGSARLATHSLEEEIAGLPDTLVAVGGAGLAAACIERGLIDEFRLFVNPVVVGGGTRFFPPGAHVDLELVETRTFASKVVYSRYRRAGSD